MGIYVLPRATRDFDFIIHLKPEDAEVFVDKFKQGYYFGKEIYIVSAEDLLLSKIIWVQDLQSGLQFEDIKSLAKIEKLDWVYINKWIKQLNLTTFNLLQ